jgi:hypothetical protein
MPEHVASNVMLADSRLETPLSGAPSAHCDPEVNDAPAGLAAGGPMLSDVRPNAQAHRCQRVFVLIC